jgi:sugar O-acyltransferase (sialic acid O-acetyltransferase NeuD family)
MKELIIVGAGGFGRELLQWIKDINIAKSKWKIRGFIDDNQNALDKYDCDYPVIGSIENWLPKETEIFACAICNPKIKELVVTNLKSKGAMFTDVIHPTAIIGDHNSIGEGLIMYPGAGITVNSKIGNFVTILTSGIGHDVEICDYVSISSFCNIAGGVKIGKRVFIGGNTIIIPNRKIGDNAYIAAGSVVVTNIKQNIKVMGNPAKKYDF